jgi:hypothetical protein
MGYQGKLLEKQTAQNLRSQGYSYNQILLKVSVSKDTLSRWCRDIELNDEQELRLILNKRDGQKKGSLIAAKNKRDLRNKNLVDIYAQSKLEVGELSKRDRFIAGISLYFGEGDKGDARGGLANSDPRIIQFMMSWFREFALVPEDRFRGALWIHEGSDETSAQMFWSALTKIPVNKFHKTYIAKNKVESNKIRKQIHPYGIFSIRFSCSNIHRQIMGWISAFYGDRILDTLYLKERNDS